VDEKQQQIQQFKDGDEEAEVDEYMFGKIQCDRCEYFHVRF